MTSGPARPPDSGRTVWLASYPKSGNTWVRAIVTALDMHTHLFGVDHLTSGAQPFHVAMALGEYGLDPRWFSRTEIDAMRAGLVRRIDAHHEGSAPILRKTHERYRVGEPGAEPFPLDATRAAILVVRDPRDVACSYAPFFGMTLDEAVDALGAEVDGLGSSPADSQTAQPWGSWTTMNESWLSPDVPFPVHLVHYEALQADAAGTLEPILEAIGLACTPESLADAVATARFERLQESEAERGFRATSPKTTQFFRRGTSGGWRDTLTTSQLLAIEADHAEAMARFGYPLTTDSVEREAMREARDSRRRQAATTGLDLPPALGLTVIRGPVPEALDGAERPRPWIHLTPEATLLRFANGARLLVSGGRELVIDWPTVDGEDDADPAWIVQGWGVTLAMLQRGLLSLHAASVEVGARVIAVAGQRGAGKSTTAMGLRARGHALLCDDVTLVEFRDGAAWTMPYSRNVHLLEDAAAAVGVDFAALPPLAGRHGKSAFRAEEPSDTPRRIDRIIVLSASDAATKVSVSEATGAARMTALLDHTDRDGIAPLVLGPERYFAEVAHLADLVPITVVARPRGEWTLDAVLDAIEAAAGE